MPIITENQLRIAVDSGMTAHEIARYFKMHPASIYDRLRKLGLKADKKHYPKVSNKDLIRLDEQGFKGTEIASMHDLSPTTIYQRRKRLGISKVMGPGKPLPYDKIKKTLTKHGPMFTCDLAKLLNEAPTRISNAVKNLRIKREVEAFRIACGRRGESVSREYKLKSEFYKQLNSHIVFMPNDPRVIQFAAKLCHPPRKGSEVKMLFDAFKAHFGRRRARLIVEATGHVYSKNAKSYSNE